MARPSSSEPNLVGTYTLLQEALRYWRTLSPRPRGGVPLPACLDRRSLRLARRRRVLHRDRRRTIRARPIPRARPARITWRARGTGPTACRWSSPTARTTTGRTSFPEKLIPLTILKALARRTAAGVWQAARTSATGCTSTITRARCDWCSSAACPGAPTTSAAATSGRNIDVVRTICALLDELRPDRAGSARASDRLRQRSSGARPALRDRRHAPPSTSSAGARARTSSPGSGRRCEWYLANHGSGSTRVMSGAYRGERLGTGSAT